MVSHTNSALWVIPALPLATAVINLFVGRRLGRWAGWLAPCANPTDGLADWLLQHLFGGATRR